MIGGLGARGPEDRPLRQDLWIDDLACGAHLPLDPESAQLLTRSDRPATALHNNCSGKHIGMLALAELLGSASVTQEFVGPTRN